MWAQAAVANPTLLHMLGGLDRPSSGKVFVDGKDIFSLKDEEVTIFRRKKNRLCISGI